ncbi:MAG TPA: tetratricopeptide repeat protein [Candidatus Omnitrophota bacterium]|nr:tetratricopeptide repeat protein [Candidatus Omnitrophota bacterium]
MEPAAPTSHQRFGLREFFLLILILGITFLSFLPTLQNDFTNWDDTEFILDNAAVLTLDWEHIKDSFKTVYVKVYCPLTVLSWTLEHRFFGFDPFIFHLDNLLLHLWVTGCVFVLALRLGLPTYAGALAALLFGVHPMHVESVCWMSERKDVLFASFYVPALLAYWSYLKKHSKRSYSVSVLLGLLSMLSKPTALSLPVALFVLDWFAGRKFDKRTLLDKIPYFLYIIPLTYMTFQHHTELVAPLPGEDITKAIPIFFWTFSFYIQKFLWPFNVIPYYQLPEPIGFGEWPYMSAVIVFVVYMAFLVRFRKSRWFIFAFLFFMATIFFLLRYGVLVRYTSVVADRHIYIPSIGFCLFFGWLFYTGFQKLGRKGAFVKAAVVIAVALVYLSFAAKTFLLARVWKDSITFWTYVIEKNPQYVAKAYGLRASAYVEKEEWDLALKDANAALVGNPYSDSALNVRGIVYSHRGNDDLALEEFNQVISRNTLQATSFINRANVYVAMGRFDEAIADGDKAVELEPNNAKAYAMRGKAYGLRGDFERSFADLDRAVYLNPENYLTYYDRGFFLSQQGKHDAAIAEFNKALQLKPDDFFMLDQRGTEYYLAGRYDLAQKDFDKVLELGPDYARGYNNRGTNYMAQGQYDLALVDLNEAIALDSRYAVAYMNRSLTFQAQQQWEKALADALKARELGYEISDEDINRIKEKALPSPINNY